MAPHDRSKCAVPTQALFDLALLVGIEGQVSMSGSIFKLVGFEDALEHVQDLVPEAWPLPGIR